MSTPTRPPAAHHLSRRGQVEPFHVMELLKAANLRAATHGDVISLCAGQPSTPAPEAVRRAAIAALQSAQVMGYTDAVGMLTLRQAIAAHYGRAYDVEVDPDQVVVTTGSSGAFTAVFLAAFDAGDTVLMTRPGYPAYRNTLAALGCRVVELDCGPDVRYQPTVAMLEQYVAQSAPSARPPAGLIIASPANPTGTIIDSAELAAIAAWCDAHGTLLISDEIYHGVTYGRRAACAWETSRNSVVVGSFSKYFSMTGWRIGWVVLPPYLVRPIELLLGNLNICAPAISQVAALEAFSDEAREELEGHVARYASNRDLLLRRLPELGVAQMAPPDGAFYAYADVSHLTSDSTTWCAQILEATGVALTPGVDFAPDRLDVDGTPSPLNGSRFIRLCSAGTTDEIDEALTRVAKVLGAFA